MQRNCDHCGVSYNAKRKTSRYHSPNCRTAASRARAEGRAVSAEVVHIPPAAGGLLGATRRELDVAGRLDSALGQQALAIAARIAAGTDSGSSLAALSKELRAVMGAALADVAAAVDPVDELRAWRDRKRAAAR